MVNIKIISSEDLRIIEKEINEALADGYVMQGGLSIVNMTHVPHHWPRYYQTMIKELQGEKV